MSLDLGLRTIRLDHSTSVQFLSLLAQLAPPQIFKEGGVLFLLPENTSGISVQIVDLGLKREGLVPPLSGSEVDPYDP